MKPSSGRAWPLYAICTGIRPETGLHGAAQNSALGHQRPYEPGLVRAFWPATEQNPRSATRARSQAETCPESGRRWPAA